MDLALFYEVSALQEAFPQSFFQNKSTGELLTIMDGYDEYLRAFKLSHDPEQTPITLRDFYERGCPDMDQGPRQDGPSLEL